MRAIYKREMLAYFISPIGYVFAAIFFAISGAAFAMTTFFMQTADTTTYFILMLLSFIVLIPLLTMKLLSEERGTRTEQVFLTAPVSLAGVVFAKFLAAYTLFAGTLLVSSLFNIFSLYTVAKGQEDVIAKMNLPSVIGSLAGILVIGAVFIAVGLFLSSLTETQIVAAVSSIGVFVLFFLFSLLPSVIGNGFLRTVVRWFSVFDRFYPFTDGIFDLTAMVYYASLTVIFLFLTVRVYEKRRWA